jgi:acyl-CoA synthetase (AMP-forming)/AMP-acid ligase II
MPSRSYDPLANLSNLVEILQWRALQRPGDRAYLFLANGENEERSLTYQELEQCAQSLGALLQAQGFTGKRALLFFPPGPEYVEAFWGCLYAGVVAIPVYQPKLNRSIERLRGIILDTDAALVLTNSRGADALARWFIDDVAFAHLRWLITDELSLPEAPPFLGTRGSGDTVAYIQYTSGTTAPPRGVMISQENILQNVAFLHRRLAHPVDRYMVSWLPPYHDMGLVSSILLPVYAGFPVVIMPPAAFIQRPLRWLEAISLYQAATSGGPNFAYELCIHKSSPEQVERLNLSCWTAAFNGSEPIDWRTLENFSRTFASSGFRLQAFYPCYGLAEATLFVAGGERDARPRLKYFRRSALTERLVEEVGEQENDACALVSCGSSAEDHLILIVDPVSLTRCPAGQVGEIWASGPSIARAYWNNDEETAHLLQAHLADSTEQRFLRTGDLGFLWQGELFVAGRLQNMLHIHGKLYYSEHIEQSACSSHPSLCMKRNAAFLQEDQLVIVQEVNRHLRREERDEIVRAMRLTILREHFLEVSAITLIRQGSIPKTSSGKIKHYECQQRFLDGTLETVYQAVCGLLSVIKE